MRESKTMYLFCCIIVLIFYTCGYYICDDAIISFNVAENLFSGFGPVYTAGERVQVHTNPLWVFLLSASRFLMNDYGHITLILNTVLLAGAMFLMWRWVKEYAFLFLAVLFASKSMFSFMGSGLENPLTYFLIVLAFYSFFSEKYKLFVLVVAFIGINRLDTLLLFIPCCLWLFRYGFWKTVKLGVVYGMPLWLFLGWTVIYYGFLLPNTYYAKVGSVTFGYSEFIAAGIAYCFGAIQRAPLDLALILFAILLPWTMVRDQKLRVMSVGVLLTFLYIFKVGADQMFPRMLAVPTLAASLLLIYFMTRYAQTNKNALTVGACILFCGVVLPWTPVKTLAVLDKIEFTEVDRMKANIINFGVFMHDFQISWTPNRLVKSSVRQPRFSRKDIPNKKMSYKFAGLAGKPSFKHGPFFKNFDPLGLADPLLSRFPAHNKRYNPGHNPRLVPIGYPETVITGENQIADPVIARYYDKLKILIHGPLFTYERLKTILEMNFKHSTVGVALNEKNAMEAPAYKKMLKKKFGKTASIL